MNELTIGKHHQTPAETTAGLRSLASRRNVTLSGGKRLRGSYDATGALIGTEVVECGMIARGSDEDMAAVADAITQSLAPAPVETIEEWIAELSVIAPSKADDAMTATLKLEAYARRLETYPADMVRDALLGRTWRFFPSWFELEQVLEDGRRERDAMLNACLSGQPRGYSEPPKRETATAEQRARADDILKQAGFAVRRANVDGG